MGKVSEFTNQQEWRYCPIESNPSDILTRGINADQYIDSIIGKSTKLVDGSPEIAHLGKMVITIIGGRDTKV